MTRAAWMCGACETNNLATATECRICQSGRSTGSDWNPPAASSRLTRPPVPFTITPAAPPVPPPSVLTFRPAPPPPMITFDNRSKATPHGLGAALALIVGLLLLAVVAISCVDRSSADPPHHRRALHGHARMTS